MSQTLVSRACRATKGPASSPAAFFVQLFRRSFSAAAPSLLSSSISRHSGRQLVSQFPAVPAVSVLRTQQSTFSTTASRYATKVLINPRTNDEGNPLEIIITPRAAQHLHKITAPEQPPEDPSREPPTYEYLRVTVESGGCHGFQYQMSLESPEKIDPEEDTVFAYEPEEGDDYPRDVYGGARVVMDLPSLEVLYGSKIDFTQELIGSQFVIADNPRATSSCGCGTSFDIA
ncbi:hypothetical protein KEM56_003076 [Ascosphaera pollenicola]|nr:hypothetical protein KEM56_003076 [Ascosphaera pollenicola]